MNKRLGTIVGVALAAVVAVSFTAAAQSADPWVGTWKVNLAKSTYSPGPKPKTAATVKMESNQGGMKAMIDGTDDQGNPTHVELSGKFDGKDNPVVGAPAPNSTDALKRIDARTIEIMGKTDGKPTMTTKVVISADGKTMTATQAGRNAQGQAVNNVIVADRQ